MNWLEYFQPSITATRSTNQSRMDYLLACLELNPEYRLKEAEELWAWRSDIIPFLEESLQTMRSTIPPSIFTCSKNDLKSLSGYSAGLVNRIFTKKCLWLVRLDPGDLLKIHPADMSGKYGVQSLGLDIVEVAAIIAVAPVKFVADSRGQKEQWRASLEELLKAMYKEFKSDSLNPSKMRHPAYKNQVGAFGDVSDLYSSHTVSADEDLVSPATRRMLAAQLSSSDEVRC